MPRVILFDVDGVMALPEDMFSVTYTRDQKLDPKPFEDFFRTEWTDIVTGKKNLKESIDANPDLWQWSGTTEQLLEYWFKSEDIKNEKMIELVRTTRASGTPCYLATEQEHYRGEYMKNVMFPELFDGYFVSAELGVKKSNPVFYEKIMVILKQDYPDLEPSDVMFFDDTQSKVDSALEAGLDAHLFENVDQVRSVLGIPSS